MLKPMLTDIEAYPHYPWARWVYNKLLLSQALHYECAPHGILPKTYPVFSKPIMNLEGMALGSKVWNSPDDVEYIAGHYWMPLFTGIHCSYDVQLKGGEVVYCKKAIATHSDDDHKRIQYWKIFNSDLNEAQNIWKNLLPEFTGYVNFETIGGKIIEVHLRWAAEWYDWYDTPIFYSVPVWWKELPKDIDIPPNTCYVKNVCSDITNQSLEIKRSHIILCEDLAEGLALRDKIISNN
jgi:hypothetical protein